MKDNFSGHASEYAQFRPSYPQELYDIVLKHVPQRQRAWDCATGNGQVANVLGRYFEQVEATDISSQQLANATASPNVRYSVQPAEKTTFPDAYFDLITVAQAVHWFDFPLFFKEVKRVLRPNGLIVLIGYGLMEVEGLTDLVSGFYADIVGPYWDPERRHIEEKYATIPFDFKEIKLPPLTMQYRWTKDQLLGYLSTWSAVKHYEKATGKNPLGLIKAELDQLWGKAERRKVTFPLILKAGKN